MTTAQYGIETMKEELESSYKSSGEGKVFILPAARESTIPTQHLKGCLKPPALLNHLILSSAKKKK